MSAAGRLTLAGMLTAAVLVALPATINALGWIGRPFAGFLFLENGIVISMGRASWDSAQSQRMQWARLRAVDGTHVSGAREAQKRIVEAGPGRTVKYALQRGTEDFGIALPVRTFTSDDFAELFAPMLVVGALFVVVAVTVVWRRPDLPQSWAFFPSCFAFGLTLLTSPDQYGPFWFSPVYALATCAVPPGMIHLALTFPHTRLRGKRWPWLLLALYLPFVALAWALVAFRGEPALFLPVLYTVYFFLANALLLYVGGIVYALIERTRERRPLWLALAGLLSSSGVWVAILVAYPLLRRPISPAWMLSPLVLMPVLTAAAFLGLPAHDPEGTAA